MTTGTTPLMSPKLALFLAIALTWAALVGVLLFAARIPLDSFAGIALIAVLYMPSPFVAAVIAERGLVRERFRLPRGGARAVLLFVLAPAVAIVGVVLVYLAIVFLLGNVLQVPGLGTVATTSAELMTGAASLLGQEAVDAAGPPPPAFVLLLAGIWGAIVAGWTINGLFAMGEEYGWRGLMWDELKQRGPIAANLIIGTAWGLWHAPLILQGYNYPGFPILGAGAMVLVCIGMSFVLTAVRELTSSLLPVAAAHGMFNALAPILLLLIIQAHPLLSGPLGLLSAAVFLAMGAALWRWLAGRRIKADRSRGAAAAASRTATR